MQQVNSRLYLLEMTQIQTHLQLDGKVLPHPSNLRPLGSSFFLPASEYACIHSGLIACSLLEIRVYRCESREKDILRHLEREFIMVKIERENKWLCSDSNANTGRFIARGLVISGHKADSKAGSEEMPISWSSVLLQKVREFKPGWGTNMEGINWSLAINDVIGGLVPSL